MNPPSHEKSLLIFWVNFPKTLAKIIKIILRPKHNKHIQKIQLNEVSKARPALNPSIDSTKAKEKASISDKLLD